MLVAQIWNSKLPLGVIVSPHVSNVHGSVKVSGVVTLHPLLLTIVTLTLVPAMQASDVAWAFVVTVVEEVVPSGLSNVKHSLSEEKKYW